MRDQEAQGDDPRLLREIFDLVLHVRVGADILKRQHGKIEMTVPVGVPQKSLQRFAGGSLVAGKATYLFMISTVRFFGHAFASVGMPAI
jgi:hypothetical protein